MNKNIVKLLLVCFLDMMSYAIFSPVAAFLFLDGDYSLVPKNSENRYLLFGLFLSTYSLVQVFSSPFLGVLAVRTSKKFVLLCSFIGNVLGYLLCAYGIFQREIFYLYLGCACAGVMGANMSMINAFISCETKTSHWSQNYSLFGAVIGSAFIIGPQISALFISFFEGFGAFYVILLFCSFLSIINCFLVNFLIFESYASIKDKRDFSFLNRRTFFNLNKDLLRILIFLFCIYFSWLSFIKFFQVYLFDVFSLNEKDCCQMTSFLGFCCCLWQGLRFFLKVKFVDKYNWLVICTALMFLNFLVYILFENLMYLAFMTLTISFSYAVLVPSTLSLLFKKGEEPKAYKSSLYQSVKALAQILAPLSSGYILSQDIFAPNLFTVFIMLSALLLIFVYRGSFKLVTNDEPISEVEEVRVG